MELDTIKILHSLWLGRKNYKLLKRIEFITRCNPAKTEKSMKRTENRNFFIGLGLFISQQKVFQERIWADRSGVTNNMQVWHLQVRKASRSIKGRKSCCRDHKPHYKLEISCAQNRTWSAYVPTNDVFKWLHCPFVQKWGKKM